MKSESRSRLPTQCFYFHCPSRTRGPQARRLVRKGFYRRRSDSRVVARFSCRVCLRSFSRASFSPCFRQKRRNLNFQIRGLLVSGVSQRRIARLLGISRTTVERKFLFLAVSAARRHRQFLKHEIRTPIRSVQFDEMESFEKSKCLPVSIPLVVTEDSRKILGFRVCSMPAKGPLAKLAWRKYGPRKDERSQAARTLFLRLQRTLDPEVRILSDQNPRYPGWVHRHWPQARHECVKGRRGCVVGQGELKRGGWDPLFSLNHSAAMLRANLNRLFRRTWCTTKRRDRLAAHLWIYVDYHNHVLTPH